MRTRKIGYGANLIRGPGARLATGLSLLIGMGCSEGSGADAPDPTCERGQTGFCMLDGPCNVARRTCIDDPPRWGPCECKDAAPKPADAGGRPASLGAACDRDGDCPSGAFCLTLDSNRFFGGGSPASVCVADCTDDEAACDAFDGTVCFGTGIGPQSDAGPEAGAGERSALCFARCAIGSPEPDKCGAVPAVACAPIAEDSSTDGFCRPVCTTDADCPDRACDPRTGACVEAAADRSDIGTVCDPEASGECGGVCTQLSEEYAVCSHRCIFGEPGDCAALASEEPTGGCLYVTPEGSVGDVGFCAELCDCPDDCTVSGSVCDPLDDADLEAAFGRMGVCTTEELALGEPVECSE